MTEKKKLGRPFKPLHKKLVQVKIGLLRADIDRLIKIGGSVSGGIRKMLAERNDQPSTEVLNQPLPVAPPAT